MMFNTEMIAEDLKGGKEDMTENKRFTICVDSNDLKSLWDTERTEEEPLLWLTRSDRIGGIDDVCKLLNELHDKNEQLKLDLKVANDGADLYKDINEALEKENKQLKSEINEWKDRCYEAESNLIYEYSTNIEKDMKELHKEIYGDVE